MSDQPPSGPFIRQFTYPALEFGPGSSPLPPSAATFAGNGSDARTVEEEAKERETSAYRRGLLEGQQCGRAEARDLIEQAKASIAAVIAEFAQERETYYQEIEAEVVSLSLSVARKILNREAQVDPLVLKGVVHAALERLSTGTTVRLRVPPVQVENWRRVFSQTSFAGQLEIVEDPAFAGHQCRIETELGNTQLDVESQLKEIERGFADLLARAPRNGL